MAATSAISTKSMKKEVTDTDSLDGIEDLIGDASAQVEFVPVTDAQQRVQDRKFVLEQERIRLMRQAVAKKMAVQKAIGEALQPEVQPQGASASWPVALQRKPEAEGDDEESGTYVPTDIPSDGWPLLSGWLTKQGGGTTTLSRKNWKVRWFLLHSGFLTYHDGLGGKLKGTIPISAVQRLEYGRIHGRTLGFSIITEGRTYFIVGKSEKDVKAWVEAIEMTRALYAAAYGSGNKDALMMF